ncbi:hypothetical protein MY8738_005074 [Beauveria namnaoensis]
MDRCPSYASFFGAMGCAFAIVFATFGAAYGTAKPAAGIFSSGILRPERLVPNTYEYRTRLSSFDYNFFDSVAIQTAKSEIRLCAVMAQILSIYGLVCCVVMIPSLNEKMALHTAFLQLGGGLAVGLCALAAGFSIGIVGDAGGKLVLHAANIEVADPVKKVLGLYGFVISLLMITKSKSDVTRCIY